MKNVFKNYNEKHISGFKRLYWKSDKELIQQTIKHLPLKYVRKTLLRLTKNYLIDYSDNLDGERVYHPVMMRYDGYEFFVSKNNLREFKVPHKKQSNKLY